MNKFISEEEETVFMIKGIIASLPAEQQRRIGDIAGQIRSLVDNNKDNGLMALSLVGAEKQLSLSD